MAKRWGEDKAPVIPDVKVLTPAEIEFITSDGTEFCDVMEQSSKIKALKEEEAARKQAEKEALRKKRLEARRKKNKPGAIQVTRGGNEVARRPASVLSDTQLENAMERILLGETISALASELNVTATTLSVRMKRRMGLEYQRAWQQSIKFDVLRAEKIFQVAMLHFCGPLLDVGEDDLLDEDDLDDEEFGSKSRKKDLPNPKYGELALKVLEYRAKMLGFNNSRTVEQTIRVAGLSKAEIFNRIVERI